MQFLTIVRTTEKKTEKKLKRFIEVAFRVYGGVSNPIAEKIKSIFRSHASELLSQT